MKTNKLIVGAIAAFGAISSIYGMVLTISDKSLPYLVDMCVLGVIFLLISNWSVVLPSGASWRPGISVIMFNALAFPAPLAIFVSLPGLLRITVKNKNPLRQTFLMIGHINAGILATNLVFYHFSQYSHSVYYTFAVLLVSFFIHFIINRFLSACIMANKKKTTIIQQINESKKDINWGFLNIYLISFIMYLQYYFMGVVGIIPEILLLIGIYHSVNYFNKAYKLEKKAHTDALTGAENRASWERFTSIKTELNGTFALLDLNDFKKVNDNFGHDRGDLVLKDTVKKLQKDSYLYHRVFRYGGDEFILFFPHGEDRKDYVKMWIKKCILELEELWEREGLPVTISFGSVFFQGSPVDLAVTIKKADEQMYEYKKKKKRLI